MPYIYIYIYALYIYIYIYICYMYIIYDIYKAYMYIFAFLVIGFISMLFLCQTICISFNIPLTSNHLQIQRTFQPFSEPFARPFSGCFNDRERRKFFQIASTKLMTYVCLKLRLYLDDLVLVTSLENLLPALEDLKNMFHLMKCYL